MYPSFTSSPEIPSEDDTFHSSPCQQPHRQRLTILDDIDELHQTINGPGALQNDLKAKQAIQDTFDCSSNDENQLRECLQNISQSQHNQMKNEETKTAGLISYMMKIDLSEVPSQESIGMWREKEKDRGECNAPRNSYKKGEGYDLFKRALTTERKVFKKLSRLRI